MFALVAMITLALIAFGVVGLLSKQNRADEEYVQAVKEISWLGFKWFIFAPLAVVGIVGFYILATW